MVNGAPNPNYASATSLLLGFLTLVVTLAIARFGRGLWSRLAVMLGLVIGTLVATLMGGDFSSWRRAAASSSSSVCSRCSGGS